MASVTLKTLVLLLCAVCTSADDIEMELQSGLLIKMLRDMVNQTAAEKLNLPANATSIRENITDNFSCENRTYGYYADVDNDCQIFHVCLPSQSVTGRNVTYRWSFICPGETVFNQEVLTCTRPRDAVPCAESPMFYDVNMEFGKVPDETKDLEKGSDNKPAQTPTPNTEAVEIKPQRWNQANRKKQNIIAQTLFTDALANAKSIKEDMKNSNYNFVQDFSNVHQGIQNLKEEIKEVEKEIVNIKDNIKESDKETTQYIKDEVTNNNALWKNEVMGNTEVNEANKNSNDMKESAMEMDNNMQVNEHKGTIELPQSVLKKIEAMNAEPIESVLVEELAPAVQEVNNEGTAVEEFINSRIVSERSLKRKGRKLNRGSLRFRSNI